MVQDMLNVEDESGLFQSSADVSGRGYVQFHDLEVAEGEGRGKPRGQSDSATQQKRAEAQLIRQMFTVYSHVFRIHGDALLDDIMVRNEVFVLRRPLEDSVMEWPSLNVETGVENPMPDTQGAIPEEFYRILEWKVIQ
jgi:hypothetical protein